MMLKADRASRFHVGFESSQNPSRDLTKISVDHAAGILMIKADVEIGGTISFLTS